MKRLNTVITLTLLFILPSFLMAQVDQKEISMSHGPQNSYVQTHEGATDKHVEKAWEAVMKKYDGKVKKNRKSDEFETLEVLIPTISRSGLNVYMTIEEKKDMSSTAIFFDNGTSFIDENVASEASMNIEKLLVEFGYEVEKNVVGDLLKEEEKNQKKILKDFEKLEKDNKNLHEDIEKYQNKIAEAESDIEKNLVDQDNKKMEIQEQESLVEKIKDRLNNIGMN